MMISYHTKFWFYMVVFFIISFSFTLYGMIKLIKIKIFKRRLSKHYYNEIPSTFIKYEKSRDNIKTDKYLDKTFYTKGTNYNSRKYYPVFRYKYGRDEYIIRSKYAVKYFEYNAGQKVNLYQDPKTEAIFENPANGQRYYYYFIINGVIVLAFALFNIYLYLF